MIPFFIGLGVYQGIGLIVRHYKFPREPIYTAAAWPIALIIGTK